MFCVKCLQKIYKCCCNIPMIRICEIDIECSLCVGIRETRNWFRYETFIHLFEFKCFLTWGERDTIFLCWLLLHHQLSTQTTCGARSAQIRLASPSSEFRRKEINSLLFLKSPNPQPMLPVHDVTHTLWSQFLPAIFILTSLNDTSSPHARQHQR